MIHKNINGTESSRPDSSLTIAVIWDPERGLEAFPCGHLFETLNDQPLTYQNFFDSGSQSGDDSASTQLQDEPFAVLNAGRQLHYINIRSSKMYKDLVNTKCSLIQANQSSYSRDSWQTPPCFVDIKEVPVLAVPAETRQSLDSFFPLWSGRLGGHTQVDRNAIIKRQLVDDEGFFDVSSHADCDPHLPSRFSTSDTSTSAYIAIDRSVSGPGTPMALHHRSSLVSRSPDGGAKAKSVKSDSSLSDKGSGLTKSVGGYTPHLTSRLSKLLPPWMKRHRDDKWVLVEVREVVLERIVDA